MIVLWVNGRPGQAAIIRLLKKTCTNYSLQGQMQETFKWISANMKARLSGAADAGCSSFAGESLSKINAVLYITTWASRTTKHRLLRIHVVGWGFKKKKKGKRVGGWYSYTKWGLINLSRAVSERASGAERPETPDDCRLHHWLCAPEKHQKIHHFNFKNE